MKFIYFCLKNPSVKHSYQDVMNSVGKRGYMNLCEIGTSMIFHFDDGGYIETSAVQNICTINKRSIYVETQNSIYIFEK